MKQINKGLGSFAMLGLCLAILHGCADSTTPGTGNGSNNFGKVGGSGDLSSTILGGTVYYTGMAPGSPANFDLYINTSRAITMHDFTIAQAAPGNITVPSSTVEIQIQQLKYLYQLAQDNMSSRRESRYRDRLQNPRVQVLKPLAVGLSTFSAESSRRAESIWQNGEYRSIVVNSYTAQQLQLGEQRYTQGTGDGSQDGTACTTCHVESQFSSSANAPSHLLGRISEIDDEGAAQWLETGIARDRTADRSLVPNGHAWRFNSPAEKYATVAYLRSKQTPSPQDYAKLLYEEELEETRVELGLDQSAITQAKTAFPLP